MPAAGATQALRIAAKRCVKLRVFYSKRTDKKGEKWRFLVEQKKNIMILSDQG